MSHFGKKKKFKVVNLEADNLKDALEQIKEVIGAQIGVDLGSSEDHRGHGCAQDPEKGTLAGTKKIVKSWKATPEEIKADKELSKLVAEHNAFVDKAKKKEREHQVAKDKLWTAIRLRLNNFDANVLQFDTEKGEIHLVEKAFKNDK